MLTNSRTPPVRSCPFEIEMRYTEKYSSVRYISTRRRSDEAQSCIGCPSLCTLGNRQAQSATWSHAHSLRTSYFWRSIIVTTTYIYSVLLLWPTILLIRYLCIITSQISHSSIRHSSFVHSPGQSFWRCFFINDCARKNSGIFPLSHFIFLPLLHIPLNR